MLCDYFADKISDIRSSLDSIYESKLVKVYRYSLFDVKHQNSEIMIKWKKNCVVNVYILMNVIECSRFQHQGQEKYNVDA